MLNNTFIKVFLTNVLKFKTRQNDYFIVWKENFKNEVLQVIDNISLKASCKSVSLLQMTKVSRKVTAELGYIFNVKN